VVLWTLSLSTLQVNRVTSIFMHTTLLSFYHFHKLALIHSVEPLSLFMVAILVFQSTLIFLKSRLFLVLALIHLIPELATTNVVLDYPTTKLISTLPFFSHKYVFFLLPFFFLFFLFLSHALCFVLSFCSVFLSYFTCSTLSLGCRQLCYCLLYAWKRRW